MEVEKITRSYLNEQGKVPREEIEKIEKSILGIKRRIASLVTFAEKGLQLDEIADRVRELEYEKENLELKQRQLQWFFSTFKDHFDRAPISERKALIHRLIDRIEIDRQKMVARCFLLRLPKGEGKIVDELLEKERTHLKSVPPRNMIKRCVHLLV